MYVVSPLEKPAHPWGRACSLKGRFLVNPLEKPARLVGAGVAWSMGGDACVAPIGIKLSEEKRRKEDNKGLHMPS